jgi:DNA-binding XRE family transcriptional regulator
MTSRQIITQDGKPAFVVIPYDEWRQIEAVLEDRADVAAVRAYLAHPTEGLPEAVVRAIVLEGMSPIKALREHRGLTQAALAAAAETTPVYLSQIERGERSAGRKLLARLAAALRVPVDVLQP